MKSKIKAPVTERAVMQRINRVLANRNECLKKARRYSTDTGNYYIVNVHFNRIEAGHCDPAKLARELGVLKPYEELR